MYIQPSSFDKEKLNDTPVFGDAADSTLICWEALPDFTTIDPSTIKAPDGSNSKVGKAPAGSEGGELVRSDDPELFEAMRNGY